MHILLLSLFLNSTEPFRKKYQDTKPAQIYDLVGFCVFGTMIFSFIKISSHETKLRSLDYDCPPASARCIERCVRKCPTVTTSNAPAAAVAKCSHAGAPAR